MSWSACGDAGKPWEKEAPTMDQEAGPGCVWQAGNEMLWMSCRALRAAASANWSPRKCLCFAARCCF